MAPAAHKRRSGEGSEQPVKAVTWSTTGVGRDLTPSSHELNQDTRASTHTHTHTHTHTPTAIHSHIHPHTHTHSAEGQEQSKPSRRATTIVAAGSALKGIGERIKAKKKSDAGLLGIRSPRNRSRESLNRQESTETHTASEASQVPCCSLSERLHTHVPSPLRQSFFDPPPPLSFWFHTHTHLSSSPSHSTLC